MHAMRGISAHSNGFQACRAIHFLQVLLGSVDCPGGHLAKPPYPKHIVPPIKPGKKVVPGQPLESFPLGFPTEPEDLCIDKDGNPLRIDKAYSWEAPIANHGLMHMAITNAVAGDPYEIDTMIFFMANMAWNSSMNTSKIREDLCAKNEDGEYKIPFLVVCDAFDSETVGYADLVIPDTTYLERYDTISILDRPISEPHAVCDSIRSPILKPDRDVRPWQTVLVELASRLKFPEFTTEDGGRKYKDYKDFIVNYEKAPGIGFLAGWRGKDGEKSLRGEPNQNQWEKYIENAWNGHEKGVTLYKSLKNQNLFQGTKDNIDSIDIKINVETAFNDSGADLLDIGVVGNSDLYVNDANISATGSLALGAAALCATWLDVGTSDVQVAFIYNGANNDASAGAGTFTIMYAQNINITA